MKGSYLLYCLLLFLKPETHRIVYHIDPKSRFTVYGTSNINKFRCVCDDPFPAGQLYATVQQRDNKITFDQAFLKIPAKGIDCNNRIMNRELYRYIKADDYPFIEINLIRASSKDHKSFSELQYNKPYCYEAETIIQLAGVKQVVPVNFEVVRKNNQLIHMTAQAPVLMSRFRLKPKNMIQLFKVHDKIDIRFNLYVSMKAQSE